MIKTYQDLEAIGANEEKRMAFVRGTITWHTSTPDYSFAIDADAYYRGRNTTILSYEKTIINALGQMIPDKWSANYHGTSNFFNIFMNQITQFLLGNGVKWGKQETKAKLGRDFDTELERAGLNALIGGVSYLFWDNGTLHSFKTTEFAPLYDEETGDLKAGVRFWRLDTDKPLRATLYETDGYTEYIWRTRTVRGRDKEEGAVLQPKRAYIIHVKADAKDLEDGTEIREGENYPSFPIVPLWGNPQHKSELVPLKEKIDAYDMILNGFANDLDNAQLYWLVKGAEGMDQEDLRRFLGQLHALKIANPGDGQEVQAVTVNIPYEARQQLLTCLENRLYKDAQALDPRTISGGAATATQIRAAYEPLNTKADLFEYCVLDALYNILTVAGIDDTPTFVRSMVMNIQEEIQSLVMAVDHLPGDYITRRILTVLGDGDLADEAIAQLNEQTAPEDADGGEMDDFFAEAEEMLNGFLGGETDGGDAGTEKAEISA